MRRKVEALVNRVKSVNWTANLIFCCFMGTGLLITLTALFITSGDIFSKLFFEDVYDTGMDFFHSIEYTKGRSPYALYNTLYPPLANLLFYLLFCLVPSWQHEQWADTFIGGIKARGTNMDLRVIQPTMLMFIIFIMLFSALFVMLVKRILSKTDKAGIVALFMLFSYGILYAIERGNIILISLLLTMFFVFFRNSKKAVIREFALLSLAFAAGLKIYPAVFGILLLYDKEYKKAIRTAIYGILFFIVPVFVFKEGISGIGIFFRVLTSFTGGSGELSANGFSFSSLITALCMGVNNITHIGLNTFFFQSILPKISLVVVLLLLIFGFWVKKGWQKTLLCCLAFILFSEQGAYTLIFLLIPLLELMKDNQKITEDIIFPYTALIITQVMLPLQRNNDSNGITGYYLRFQICILVLLIYVFSIAGKRLCNYCKHKSSKKETSMFNQKEENE